MTGSLFPLGWAHDLAGGLLIGLGVSLLFVLTFMGTGFITANLVRMLGGH